MLGEFPETGEHVDVLIIGEAPGKDENRSGQPFVGASGQVLRKAIHWTPGCGLRIGITNIVACRPVDLKKNTDRVPAYREIFACSPRLAETIKATSPAGIFLLGRTAEIWSAPAIESAQWDGLKFALPHPAQVSYNSLDFEKFVNLLRKAFDEVIKHGQT